MFKFYIYIMSKKIEELFFDDDIFDAIRNNNYLLINRLFSQYDLTLIKTSEYLEALLKEYVNNDINIMKILIENKLFISEYIIRYSIIYFDDKITIFLLENFTENISNELIDLFQQRFEHKIIIKEKNLTISDLNITVDDEEEQKIIIKYINDCLNILDLLLKNNNENYLDRFIDNFEQSTVMLGLLENHLNGINNKYYRLYLINYFLLFIYHNKNINSIDDIKFEFITRITIIDYYIKYVLRFSKTQKQNFINKINEIIYYRSIQHPNKRLELLKYSKSVERTPKTENPFRVVLTRKHWLMHLSRFLDNYNPRMESFPTRFYYIIKL